MKSLDQFTQGYILAALWSSTDDKDRPLDDNYGIGDLSAATKDRMIADCAKFQADNADLLGQVSYPRNDSTDLAHAGHDFWLTRNHHGSGFWDGDLPDDLGKALTAAAHKFGQVDLYVGDDGKIYS